MLIGTILWHLISTTSTKGAVFNAQGQSQSFIQSLFISHFSPYHLRSFHHHALRSTSGLRFCGGALINLRPGPKPEFYICRLHGPDANPKNRLLERPGASNGYELFAGHIKDLQRHMGGVSPRHRPARSSDLIRLYAVLTPSVLQGFKPRQCHQTHQSRIFFPWEHGRYCRNRRQRSRRPKPQFHGTDR